MLKLASICSTAVLLFLTQLPAATAEMHVDVRFSSDEISLIRAFYIDSHSAGRGGKKRPKQLPPGIAKKLARGKPLPPGIAKQVLPQRLVDRLPPPRAGFERIVVDGKILLVEIATQVVHDMLVDVIF